MMKAHKHAEVIKAWAEGADVQYLETTGEWRDTRNPMWGEGMEYRVKPAEPEPPRIIDSRGISELAGIYHVLWREHGAGKAATYFAADVLRHACGAGQVVPREEFDRAAGDRKARDMAVAKEVVKSVCWVFGLSTDARFDEAYLLPVIARANP